MPHYTQEQIASIEKVRNIFAEIFQKRKDIDLVYSEKAGYVLLYEIRFEQDRRLEMEPILIGDGAELFDFLLYEVACATFSKFGTMKDVHEANKAEKEIVMRELVKYLEQAPEYRYLAERQFISPLERRNERS